MGIPLDADGLVDVDWLADRSTIKKDGSFSAVPDEDELQEWMEEGGCEATDGCWVEPDGTCPHGCKSWLLELGWI